jgi:hypothetical protein
VAHRTQTALTAAALVACGSGSDDGATLNVNGEQVERTELREIVDALCAARARAPEPQGARAAFFGRAHEPLHTLARAVQATDRRAAGELLRAKQAVEADLGGPAGGGDLEADLRLLAAEAVQALAEVGIEAKPCRA